MERTAILEQIRDFVQMNFVMTDDHLEEDASLTEEGILDSTGIVELVLFLEETFGVEIADDDVVPERFDTLARLTDYVATLRTGAMLRSA